MKRITLIFLICLLSVAILQAQSLKLKGHVVTGSQGIPVEYANVVLNTSDSVFVTGTMTDNEGHFSFSNLRKGSYQLVISCLGFDSSVTVIENMVKNIDFGELHLDSAMVALDEITVSASKIVNKVDRKILFPSAMQIKKSPNGVELLRNMHLNGILMSRSDNTIKGVRGGEVQLRVNGAKADIKEVQALNPKDIVRVEFHDEPSMRYGDAEAVVDYIVRRRESGGSVMIDAANSPVTLFGENMISTKLNHRKSEFELMYYCTYRGYNKMYRTNEEIFNFGDGTSLNRYEDGEPARWKKQVHGMFLDYSYLEPEKYLLSVSFSYKSSRVPKNNFTSLLFTGNDKERATLMTDNNKSFEKRPMFNVYYQQNLKKKQLLVFDVVGTYFNTDQQRFYKEEKNNESFTDIVSGITGNKYSIITEAIYEKQFNQGRLSTGVKHTQGFADNKYTGDVYTKTDMKQADTYFYAQWMGTVKGFMYSLGLGGIRSWFSQGGDGYKRVTFRPSLRLGYRFNDHSQLRYSGDMFSTSPALSDLSDVSQAIDSLQFRCGNPDLKPVMNYINRVNYSYNKGFITLYLSMNDYYYRKPIMEQTLRKGDKFIRTMDNQKSWHKLNMDASANLSLLDEHLNIYLGGGVNWVDSRGNNYRHKDTNWYLRSSIEGSWKNWQAGVEAYTRNNDLYGETLEYGKYGEEVVYIGLGYRWKGLMAKVSILCPGMDGWRLGRDNLNEYAPFKRREYVPEAKNLVGLNIVWNFEFGRKYEKGNKRVNNSDSDSGILSGSK